MSSSDSTPSAPAPEPTEISEAERRPSARIGAVLFRHRGWLPVPFLLVPLLARGTMQPRNWILGFVLIVLGEAIRLAGVAAAGTVTRRRSRTVQRLVTYGIFAWMRNPLYVGNFLIWIGFTVISGVLWFIPVAVLLFAIEYTLIVRYEEGVLESIFGDGVSRLQVAYAALDPPSARRHGRPGRASLGRGVAKRGVDVPAVRGDHGGVRGEAENWVGSGEWGVTANAARDAKHPEAVNSPPPTPHPKRSLNDDWLRPSTGTPSAPRSSAPRTRPRSGLLF